jgi:NitT/TauT family transport system substrate-binding protein
MYKRFPNLDAFDRLNRRKFVEYSVLAAASGLFAACSQPPSTTTSSPQGSTTSGKDKVVASWLPIMQTSAYYIALEEGLFEKAGLEVESVKFENPNQIIDSLVSGRADFGPPGAAAGITALAVSKSPDSLKVFGLQGGQTNPSYINDGLIVKKDSRIASFKDLRGGKIGTIPGIQWKTITRFILRQNGLDPDTDVTIEQMAVGLHISSVLSGAVDATLSLEPIGSIATTTGQAKRVITNAVAGFISDPFYSGAAVLSNKFIKERPEVAKRVVQVIDEATKLANQDFDKYRPILSKYTALKPDQVGYVAQPLLRSFADLNDTDINSYQKFVDVFFKEGVLQKAIDVKTLMLDKSQIGL